MKVNLNVTNCWLQFMTMTQTHRAAYKEQKVSKHNQIMLTYQNQVTSQTTCILSHVQFLTANLFISAKQNNLTN